MVFLPSMRYGSFSVETSYQPSRSLRSATYFPQSEISPFSFTTFAPNAWHSITFAAGVSAGITITAGIPGGGCSQGFGAELFGARYRRGHAARFERARRVQPFVFYIKMLQAHGRAQPRGAHQRCQAFAQRDRLAVRQDFAITPKRSRARRQIPE